MPPPISVAPRTSRLSFVHIALAGLGLLAAVQATRIAQLSLIADEVRALRAERGAHREELHRTELTCAQLALDLRNQVGNVSEAGSAALVTDLRTIMALCEGVRPSLKSTLLRNVRALASQSRGEVARAARLAERALVRARPPRALADPSDGEAVGNLVDIVAYDGGAVLTGAGLLNFRKHVDNPSANELRKALGPGRIGVGLLAFPTMEGYLDEREPSGHNA